MSDLSYGFKNVAGRIYENPWPLLTCGVFAVAVYVTLVNLGNARFWYDEVAGVSPASNLLQQGDIVGWDGRNLVAGSNGVFLNEDLRRVGPPFQFILSALGFAVFGVNEFGGRVFHACAGLLSLVFFHLVLRQHLPNHPRLRFIVFLFTAWSAQLLMYFRHARYYAVAVLCLIAIFYFYERYWREKRPALLAVVTLIAGVAFFNHYLAGTATMTSLALWHVRLRFRETTYRQWLAFTGCGAVVGAVGLAYLVAIGLIGGDRHASLSFGGRDPSEYMGTLPLFMVKLAVCARDIFAADWLSWPVYLWFVGMLWIVRRAGRLRPTEPGTAAGLLPWNAANTLLLLGGLFAVTTALLSVQPVWRETLHLRYFLPALPLLLVMKGLFVEWTWRKSRIAGGLVAVVLLFTNMGAAPFNIASVHTRKSTLDSHPYRFVREIHHPYREVIQVVSDYLSRHARQDDLVFVPPPSDFPVGLSFYLSHRVRFCAVLDEGSVLPRAKLEAMRLPEYIWSCVPDWIIVLGSVSALQTGVREEIAQDYELDAVLDVYPGLSPRSPQIQWHEFEPLPPRGGVHVFRRSVSTDKSER